MPKDDFFPEVIQELAEVNGRSPERICDVVQANLSSVLGTPAATTGASVFDRPQASNDTGIDNWTFFSY